MSLTRFICLKKEILLTFQIALIMIQRFFLTNSGLAVYQEYIFKCFFSETIKKKIFWDFTGKEVKHKCSKSYKNNLVFAVTKRV